MNYSDVQDMKHGIYRIHWKEGGSSLAAVGSDHNGFRWFAPTNWISGNSTNWDVVDYVTQIHIASEQPVPESDEEPEAFDWSKSRFWNDPDNTPNQALIDLMRYGMENRVEGPW